MDFSAFFPTEVFPPDFVERHAHVELRSPLEVIIRPENAVVLSNAGSIVTNEVQLSMRLRKSRTTSAFDVNLRKFLLCWGRDVFAMVQNAVAQIGSGSVSGDRSIVGVISACSSARVPPLSASSKPTPNLYLRWEIDSQTGRLLAGQSLLIEHSSGIVWRVINVSQSRDTQVWALDSLIAYLTQQDVAGDDAAVSADLALTSADGRTVNMGLVTEQVLNIDENPLMPKRTIRVVNASWRQVPLSFRPSRPVGWRLHLSVKVFFPSRESCATGAWTEPITVDVQSELFQAQIENSERLTASAPDAVVEIAQIGGTHWFGRRAGNDSFCLVYALVVLD
jgi:hypothetical protein